METWYIIAILAAVALVIYFFMRRQTLATPPQPVPVQMPSAPGVSANTGLVPTNPPPPLPPDVYAPGAPSPQSASITSRVRSAIAPSAVIQNIPIIGGVAGRVANVPTAIGFKAADTVNDALAHIPVAGKVLAAPGKAATKVLKSISSWF